MVLHGHSLHVLRTLESESVDCIITSPPYWQLRDYKSEPILWDDDPNCEHDFVQHRLPPKTGGKATGKTYKKVEPFGHHIEHDIISNFCSKCNAWHGSLGLEPSISLFIKHLCDIFNECYRVLKKSGSCWVNLGDTYSTQSGQSRGKKYDNPTAQFNNVEVGSTLIKSKELKHKCLCQIPSRFAIEMCNRGWILRNEIIWHKPNAMPTSASDRFTVDFEKLFFFVKSSKYFFEQQFDEYYTSESHYSRNKRTTWSINTHSYSESHFATFPKELIKTPIKSSCPDEICSKCNTPVTTEYDQLRINTRPGNNFGKMKSGKSDDPNKLYNNSDNTKYRQQIIRTTKNKIRCDCNAEYIPGVVLDPFAGSGTVAETCLELDRKYIMIELNDEYIKLIHKRIEAFNDRFALFNMNRDII
jgi:site-specific DNA-methyltransferase (cytosine-N4-specific)